MCTCRMAQAYYSFSNTIQMIFSLGLHRKLGRNRGLGRDALRFPDYAKIQCERRTFWSAYAIDKQLSLIFGRPSHFSDDMVNQLLPDCINDEDMKRDGPLRPSGTLCYVSALVAHAELSKLMDRISREVYTLQDKSEEDRLAAAVSLSKEVERWKDCVPTYLTVPYPPKDIFRRQGALLRIAHYHAQILVLRPFLVYPFPQESFSDKKKFHSHRIREFVETVTACLQAINSVAFGRDGQQFQTLWYIHKVAFVACTALLALRHTRECQRSSAGRKRTYVTVDKQAVELVDGMMTTLAKSKSPHSMCRRYAVILEEMKAEAIRHTSQLIIQPERDKEPDEREATPPDYYLFIPEGGAAATRQPDSDSGSDSDSNSASSDDSDDNEDSTTEQPVTTPIQFEFVHEKPDRTPPPEERPARPNSPQTRPPELTIWHDWKVNDWLDLDSAAFGPISSFTG